MNSSILHTIPHDEAGVIKKKKYNHMMDIGFTVLSNNPEGATSQEIVDGLFRRIASLKDNPDEWQEAVGLFDTYETDI